MVDFTPTEEQQQLIDTIKRYAANDIEPAAHEADENEHIPSNVLKTGWDIGLIQTAIPEEFGGLGELSAVTGALAAEALARGDLATALEVLAPATFAYPVILYGTEAQKQQFLPPFVEDQMPKVSAALLEPGIFFDAHALKTTATVQGDQVTLDGEKAYVPLAATADHLLIYARDSASGKVDGYLVDAHNPGVTLGAREQLMGIRALPTYRVKLNNAQVGIDCRL
ncbi:MAG TPA: acyl-CoA dehydrogenase family protein, partial [Phototrophicaceae bacterium]|nr:acyl-CoA dehydrogenase family protein [Phototrophicaceae bacterium]